MIADDEAGAVILDRPGRREAAVGHGSAAVNVAVISIIHRVHSSGHRNCGGHIHAAFTCIAP